jgi:hypothetical protein
VENELIGALSARGTRTCPCHGEGNEPSQGVLRWISCSMASCRL